MGFYLGIAWILGVAGVLSSLARRHIPLLSAIMICLFWAVAALRYDTGFDWLVYKNYFNQFLGIPPVGSDIVPMEPLYRLLNIIVAAVFAHFQMIFLIVATFNVWVATRIIRNTRANVLFCLFFYFCMIYLPLQMGVLRQSIAVSLVLLAMLSASSQRKFSASVFFALAIGFQYSSLMYLPVFWRRATELISRKMPVFLLVVVAFYAAGVGFASIVIFILSHVPVSFISEKIAIYAQAGLAPRSLTSGAYFAVNCCILFWVNRGIAKRTVLQDYLLGSLILLVILQGLFFDFPLLWNRVQYLAVLPQSILLSTTISGKGFVTRLTALSALFVFAIVSLTYQLISPISPYIPYYSYIEYLMTGDPGTGMERTLSYYREVGSPGQASQ